MTNCIWCRGQHVALECAEMYEGRPVAVTPPWPAPPPSVVALVGRWVRHAAAIVAGTVRR